MSRAEGPARERGMVSVEIAFGALGLGLVLYALVGVFGIVFGQVRSVEAATEIARQAARGDEAAVAEILAGLPGDATVARSETATAVRVRVDLELHPWGAWLVPVTVGAEAETRKQG
ncbi:MAG: hypothetical protein LBR33_09155 [Propionibacteriaceae bacterium]|nr:hypothetical protein [Propionibacteriaceae bacterium]